MVYNTASGQKYKVANSLRKITIVGERSQQVLFNQQNGGILHTNSL